jgi:hypothetical protein
MSVLMPRPRSSAEAKLAMLISSRADRIKAIDFFMYKVPPQTFVAHN